MDEVKKYSVLFSPKAEKKMDKLDAPVRSRIARWIKENLVDCENPRLHGEALHNVLKDYWKYRIGGYRLIAKIEDDKVIIVIVNVDKRGSVYQ